MNPVTFAAPNRLLGQADLRLRRSLQNPRGCSAVAHRPLSRSTVTAGLTAALLTLPMAGAAVGLGETAEDSLDETTKAVEETVEETVEDVVDDDGDASTAEAEDTTTSAADPDVDDLREVVEKTTQGDVEGAVESATSTVSETAESTTDAVGEVLGDPTGGPGDASGDGGEAAEVPQGPTRSGSAPRSEPDGVFSDRTASTSSGFSARYGGTSTSPSTYSPPATSGVFDEDSPETVDDETLRSAQDPDVASLSSVPRPGDAAGPSASGVPGALLATATALLVLVGAGHALHGIRRLDVA